MRNNTGKNGDRDDKSYGFALCVGFMLELIALLLIAFYFPKLSTPFDFRIFFSILVILTPVLLVVFLVIIIVYYFGKEKKRYRINLLINTTFLLYNPFFNDLILTRRVDKNK